MTAVFADTSFFVAFLSPKDLHHDTAIRLMRTLERPLMTSAWVLSELGNTLSRGNDRRLFVSFVEALRKQSNTVILDASPVSFEAGLRLFGERSDKDWSLVDCISMAIMRKEGITETLTADHHFRQAGFTALML